MATSLQHQRNDIISAFFSTLGRAGQRLLLLDYDGTLAPFRPEREQAFPYPEVRRLLGAIRDLGTRVVLISARRAVEVQRLLRCPGIEIFGSHGIERLRPSGRLDLMPVQPGLKDAISRIEQELEVEGLLARMELKLCGTAVHWRGLPPEEAANIAGKVQRAWERLPHRELLCLQLFEGGIEIRLSKPNKVQALEQVLAGIGRDAALAFLGDDLADEDVFLALRGRGLRVLVRENPRPTEADIWLRPPQDLQDFLRRWIVACEGIEP
jgi:trehalose-phosphatase